MKAGILRRLQIGMMLFGIAMGFVFPVYATFFVEFKPGLKLWFNLGCIIAGISVGAFSFLLVKIILISQLTKLADVCKGVSGGNLNVSANIESDDQIGAISNGFNLMVGKLRQLIGGLTHGVEKIGLLSEEAATAVKQINQSLGDATGSSNEISKNAAGSGQSLARSCDLMTRLEQTIRDAHRSMLALEKNSKDIASILVIVEDIAMQTNILSLNAAVEAARAGEHGKTFATVASEVRNLAETTTHQTKTIDEMIKTLQTSISQGVVGVNASLEITAQLTAALSESAKSIGTIQGSINQIGEQITHISALSKEHAQSMDGIKTASSKLLSNAHSTHV